MLNSIKTLNRYRTVKMELQDFAGSFFKKKSHIIEMPLRILKCFFSKSFLAQPCYKGLDLIIS